MNNQLNSNLTPFIIGITGGLGTGKNLVGSILSKLGVFVIDTDEIVREILKTNNKITQNIVSNFGNSILNKDSHEYIDRTALAKIIFNDENKRKKLESILHPEVRYLLSSILDLSKDKQIIAVLVPLLFEANLQNQFHETWCVVCNKDVQMTRLLSKGHAVDDAKARINAQLTQDEKAKRSDFVIDNSGNEEITKEQIIKRLQRLAQSNHNLHLSFDK